MVELETAAKRKLQQAVGEGKVVLRPVITQLLFLLDMSSTPSLLLFHGILKICFLIQEEMAFPQKPHSVQYLSFIGSLLRKVEDMRGDSLKSLLVKILEHLKVIILFLHVSVCPSVVV